MKEDIVREHKLLFKKELDILTNKYKSFFDNANNAFNNLNDDTKSNIVNVINKLILTKNINISDNNDVLQENALVDIIYGTGKATISFLWGKILKYWMVIIGVLGIDYLYDHFIFKIISNFVPNIVDTISTIFIMTIILLGCCLAIKLYYVYYDYKNRKENSILSDKLDEINKTAKDPNRKITSLNTNKENTFRGFNNKASYNPDGEGAKDPRYKVF